MNTNCSLQINFDMLGGPQQSSSQNEFVNPAWSFFHIHYMVIVRPNTDSYASNNSQSLLTSCLILLSHHLIIVRPNKDSYASNNNHLKVCIGNFLIASQVEDLEWDLWAIFPEKFAVTLMEQSVVSESHPDDGFWEHLQVSRDWFQGFNPPVSVIVYGECSLARKPFPELLKRFYEIMHAILSCNLIGHRFCLFRLQVFCSCRHTNHVSTTCQIKDHTEVKSVAKGHFFSSFGMWILRTIICW